MVDRNSQIDIIVPFYNDSDEKWSKVLYKYMEEEGSTDRQVIGEERYRDWENFKYWFRGVEKNCPWVNKVFLVVASESQIPKWINRENPKLRIVLHKEYIPKELLPTFNVMTIENYFCNIKDLSDNYIYCNDDYFFLNPVYEDMFFKNDYPVYRDTKTSIKKINIHDSDKTFYEILNNGMDLQLKICGENAHWYAMDHLPVSHKKNFEKELIDKYKEEFIEANNKSRFRNKANYSNHVFLCLYKDLKEYYIWNNYYNSCLVSVREDTNFNDFKDKQMVCFNDTQLLDKDSFIIAKNKMIRFLESKFPEKSSFEM